MGRKKVSFFLHISYLCGKVAAKLKLLQSDCHGVRPEEQNEGHESEIWDEFAGFPYQRAAIFHTLLFAQLSPVQSCYI